jgi:hypothetical protein
MTHKT